MIEKDCGNPVLFHARQPVNPLTFYPSYPCSSAVSPVVTSASVESTSADSATMQPCIVLPLLLRLRTTLSCHSPCPSRQFSASRRLRATSHILCDFGIVSKFSGTTARSFSRPSKNAWSLHKGDALVFTKGEAERFSNW